MAESTATLRLPPEIRDMIYGYVLNGEQDVFTSSSKDLVERYDEDFGGDLRRNGRWQLLAKSWADITQVENARLWQIHRLNHHRALDSQNSILRVSRQIFTEASAVLYRRSLFFFAYDVPDINLRRFPDIETLAVNLHRIEKMLIGIFEGSEDEESTPKQVPEMLEYFARRATGLRQITLWFTFEGHDTTRPGTLPERLLQIPYLKEVFHTFAAIELFRFIISPGYGSDDIEAFEQWPLAVAEDRDWVIYKRRHERNYDTGDSDGEVVGLSNITWTLKPRNGIEFNDRIPSHYGLDRARIGDRIVQVDRTFDSPFKAF